MKPYTHKVQYYETDMMGITHHSNYVRWMEEARIDYMDKLGYPYSRMESEGIISPVRSVSCVYKRPTKFDELITIKVSVESFSGAMLALAYTMTGPDGETVCEARSEHVFVDKEGRIVRLKKEKPEFCSIIETEANRSKLPAKLTGLKRP